MEISTNYTQTTSQPTQATQTEDNSTNRSFDNYMNTNTQEDTQKANSSSKEDYIEVSETTQQTQTLTYTQDVAKVQDEAYDPDKKYLNTLDKYMPNYFEENDISKEDEKIIRFVLADNEVGDSEVRNLSFEQAKYLQEIKFDLMDYGAKNDVPVMWMSEDNLKVQHILGATTFTQNDTFNKAIFQTFVDNQTLSNHDMMYLVEELSYTLSQAYNGMKLGFNMHQAPTPDIGSSKQFKNSEFDYTSYLENLLSLLDNYLNKPNDLKTQEQYELLHTNFGQILNNYKELKENKA